MAVTERTRRIIWGEFAARCAICRKKLIEELPAGGRYSLTGEVAHIVGETENSPRGMHALSLAERNEPPNLLLLCTEHHKIIDDHEEEYPVERLEQIRSDHYDWIKANLIETAPWRSNLSILTYINVPRLALLSSKLGYDVNLNSLGDFKTLHSLGWQLATVMSAFQSALRSIFPNAVSLDSITGPYHAFIGLLCSFESKTFRTKNVPILGRDETDSTLFTGDLSKDPHIYLKHPSFKLVMNIQPRWITTTTAFTLFRPSSGQATFGGLCIITNVDLTNGIVNATPLVLGVPEPPFERASKGVPPEASQESIPLAQVADLQRGRERGLKFWNPPSSCDLCKVDFASQKFMVDGAVTGRDYWACMCERCFGNHGQGIGRGKGQLYVKEADDSWLMVAGFSSDEN